MKFGGGNVWAGRFETGRLGIVQITSRSMPWSDYSMGVGALYIVLAPFTSTTGSVEPIIGNLSSCFLHQKSALSSELATRVVPDGFVTLKKF